MATKEKIFTAPARFGRDEEFLRACREVAALTRPALLGVALARGCSHYAPLWPNLAPKDRPGLSHEILGCGLLRGPANAGTFQAIRCGAMVLSDLGNSPEIIATAAKQLGVTSRVAHIARLGLEADSHPEYWERVRATLLENRVEEENFLPGISRLVAETRLSGPGGGPVRVWLRTEYPR